LEEQPAHQAPILLSQRSRRRRRVRPNPAPEKTIVATRPDLADLLARSAREISSHGDLASTLDAVVGCLTACLPAPHHVGVTERLRDGTLETGPASHELVRELDQLQLSTGEGPTLDALTQTPVVAVESLPHDQRWNSYVPLAAGRGVRSQLAVRLAVEERTWGAITVCSTTSDHLDPLVVRMTTLFAQYAAVAVERARREDNLRTALMTRKLIGQAIGIVMERFELDEEMAFRYLVRLSSNSNVKLRDVARDLVVQANGRNGVS